MHDDPRSEARRQLLELLDTSIRRSAQLEVLLKAECEAMEAMDTDALQASLGAKRECVEALRSLDKTRSAQCSSAGFPPGPAQMDQMCAWCDPESTVRDAWTELLDVATRCRHLNDTIGAILHARRNQVSNGLAVLCGPDAGNGTYGRDANDRYVTRPRNLAKA